MVQEFHVVRCFSCQSFQVHQVKKVNRWSCKLCGEKQSLKKEFGRGSGADCRRHVQKLNAMRGAVMEKQEHNTWSLCKQEEEEEEHEQETLGSRWTKYLDPPEEAEPEDGENVLMDRQHLHGNNTADRKRKRRGETDGGRSSFSPEQSNWSRTTSAETTSSPSPSLNRPSLNRPSLNRPSPSLNRATPPSMSSGPASRWSCFLSSSERQREGAEPPVNGRSQAVGGAASLPCNDVITQWAEPPVGGRSQAVGGAASLPCNDVITQWAEPPVGGRSQAVGGAASLPCNDVITQWAEPPVGGRSQAVGGAAPLPYNDVISQALPLPRPLLPVSSMFESGEDFSFDDF
ncbi:MRN complex-interacting protein [Sander vitreus]